jgi:hypothetical protein
MVHCGYEPAAVEATFGSLAGFLRTARLAVFGAPPSRREELAPLPAAGRRLGANGLPTLPILDHVA